MTKDICPFCDGQGRWYTCEGRFEGPICPECRGTGGVEVEEDSLEEEE